MQEFITIPTYLIRELPQDKLYALMDILSMADENGEFYSTTRKLMDRWKWGSGKTYSFIKDLEKRNIIRTQTEHKQNTLFIVNTDFFGSSKNTKKTKNNQKTITKKDSEQSEDTEVYKRIIDYLNMVCGTNYKPNNKQTKEHIHARLEDGFSEEDFYIVIDKKAKEWIGTKMEQYLRPQTLFNTKFESYLNQNIILDKKPTEQMLDDSYNMMSEWARNKKMQEGFNDS